MEFLIDIPAPEDPITAKLDRLAQRVEKMTRLHVAKLKSRRDYKP